MKKKVEKVEEPKKVKKEVKLDYDKEAYHKFLKENPDHVVVAGEHLKF
jgi:hypothetical protein